MLHIEVREEGSARLVLCEDEQGVELASVVFTPILGGGVRVEVWENEASQVSSVDIRKERK